MGLLDWFKPRRKRKPAEAPPVEKEVPTNIEEHVEERPKRAKKKRKSV